MNQVLKILLLVFICELFAFASESKDTSSIEFHESFLSESDVTVSSDLVQGGSDPDIGGTGNNTFLLSPVQYNISAVARQYHNIQWLRILRTKSILRNIIRHTKYQIIKAKYIFLNSFIKDFFNSLVLKSRFHTPNYILVAKRVLII